MLAPMEALVILALLLALAVLAPRYGADSRQSNDRGWHFGAPHS